MASSLQVCHYSHDTKLYLSCYELWKSCWDKVGRLFFFFTIFQSSIHLFIPLRVSIRALNVQFQLWFSLISFLFSHLFVQSHHILSLEPKPKWLIFRHLWTCDMRRGSKSIYEEGFFFSVFSNFLLEVFLSIMFNDPTWYMD